MALGLREFQFAIDESIVESCVGSIVLRGGIEEMGESCPIDGAQTHGARFAGSIDVASLEVEIVQLCGSRTNGLHFGMGCGVAVGRYAVDAFGQDFAVSGNDGAKRSSAVAHVFEGQVNGPLHQFVVCHHNGYLR